MCPKRITTISNSRDIHIDGYSEIPSLPSRKMSVPLLAINFSLYIYIVWEKLFSVSLSLLQCTYKIFYTFYESIKVTISLSLDSLGHK